MYFTSRKKTVTFSLLSFLLASGSLYRLYVIINKGPHFFNWLMADSSCHHISEVDALSSMEDLTPAPNSIYFHETSCRGGLNIRQACAVESAARMHPDRSIYVLFSSPVSELVLSKSSLSKLTQLENVKLARMHIAEYAKGTALAEMLVHRENYRSQFQKKETTESDMLRYITLYKYGGVYLDTDMLVVKPLDALGVNWIGKVDGEKLSVAALAADKDGIGHDLITRILEDIAFNNRPKEWFYNGPSVMNRALLTYCNVTDVIDLTNDVCHGFKIHNPSKLYPVHWSNMYSYIEQGYLSEKTIESAYTHHLWNKLSYDEPVAFNSPYDKLSKKHCPTVREMYGDTFYLEN